ncbi:MAG: MMPL family transporter [Acidobacteria bacterium]|nr:MMPL family transporter [Acidobacteriota bacterium]MCB9397025.1 MMPL family transporter [Acidobacteriota bacterium]
MNTYFRVLAKGQAHPLSTLVAVLVLAGLLLVYALPRVQIDPDVTRILPDDLPEPVAFQTYLRLFSAVEPGFVVVDDPDFSLDVDVLVEALEETEGIEQAMSGPILEPYLPLVARAASSPQFFLNAEQAEAYQADLGSDILTQRLSALAERLAGFNPPEELALLKIDPTGVMRHIGLPSDFGEGLLKIQDGRFRTPDGRKQVILFSPSQPPFNADFSKMMVANLDHTLAAQLPQGGYFSFCGHLYAISDANGIRDGLTKSLGLSFVLIFVLFWLCFGRFFSFLLPMPAVLLGLATTLALMVFTGKSLNILTAAFGSVVLGLGVDAAIHMMSVVDWCDPEKARRDQAGLVRPLLSAMATTVVAFLSLCLLDLPVLRDLGFLCAVGIGVTQTSSLVLVPIFQKAFEIRPRVRQFGAPFLSRLIRFFANASPAWRWVSAILLFACVPFAVQLPFHSDLQKLRKKDARLAATEAAFQAEFNQLPQIAYWVVEAGNYREFYQALAADADQLTSAGFRLSLDPRVWLPHPEPVALEIPCEAWPVPAQLNPNAFAWPDCQAQLGQILDDADYWQALSFCVQRPDSHWIWGLKVMVPEGKDLPKLSSGVFTDLPLMNRQIEHVLKRDFSLLVLLLVPAVLLMLFLAFRHVKPVLICGFTLAFAIFLTLALLDAVGGVISLANLVVVPLLLGIGIDDALHMAVWWRDPERMQHWQGSASAIFLTTLTTVLGFGSLAVSDYPALAHMGNLVNVGLVSAMLLTLTLIPLFLGAPQKE